MELQSKLLRDLFKHDSFLLIILDACRADIFEELGLHRFGDYKRVWSCGSHTIDFLENCFPEDYYDIVYVTANPHINTKGIFFPVHKKFRRIIELWSIAWDKQIQTVHPNMVNIAVKSALTRYRKIVAHYIQPHAPYIGKTKLLRGNLWQTKQFVETGIPSVPDTMSDIDIDTLVKAYKDNLSYVFSYAYALAQYAKKKGIERVVITSDHGEILWEVKKPLIDRHPRGLAWKCLRIVPWLEIKS